MSFNGKDAGVITEPRRMDRQHLIHTVSAPRLVLRFPQTLGNGITERILPHNGV